ncbi:MAG: hypothetical protein ACYDEY_04040 [Acidimicrobiales bacterium]
MSQSSEDTTPSEATMPEHPVGAANAESLEAPRRGHLRILYLGPVAPHWEVEPIFGDRALVEEIRQRILARLVLVPPHDPQFRRNRERVSRDADRENVLLEWEIGNGEVPEGPLTAPTGQGSSGGTDGS